VINAGNGGSNYTVTYVDNLAGVITPAALTVTANDQGKIYGQTVVFAGSEFTTSGLQVGDTVGSVTLNSAGAPGTAPVAGSPYAIVPSAASGGTFTATDYTISYANGTMTVAPALLIIRADDKSVGFGQPNPAFTATYTGLVNGETPAVLTGALGFSTPRVLTSPAGAYPIAPSGQSSTNYTITYVDGVLTVTGTAGVGFATLSDNAFIAAQYRSLIMPALDYACVGKPSESRPPRADWCTQAASAEKKDADE